MRERGFTLIEILIVLAIIAIFLSTAVVSIDQINNKRLGNQAHKFKAWLEAVAEESALTGEHIGIKFYPDRRSVVPMVFAEKRWRILSNLKTYTWSDNIEIKVLLNDSRADLRGDNLVQRFKDRQSEVEDEIALLSDDENKDVPLVFPDFFVSPLQSTIPKVQVLMRQDNTVFQFEWDAIGDVISQIVNLNPEQLEAF